MTVQNHVPSVNSDTVMMDVFHHICHDLRDHLSTPPPRTLEEMRNFEWRPPLYSHPYRVKAWAQIDGWCKRYIFEEDLLSDNELEAKTNEKFSQDQLRVGKTSFDNLDVATAEILRRVRVKIKQVLGVFNEEDLYPLCSFSKNSTVGYSGENCYLDIKIGPGSVLTGTPQEIEWFKSKILPFDLQLSSLNLKFEAISSLKQVNVPKSYKIKRPVRPNSLIGSFRSIGIGRLIVKRMLEKMKINLNFLQKRHRKLAKKASRLLHLVTADLSGASDSFTSALVNRCVPRSWYVALKLGHTAYYTIGSDDESVFYSPSFMAMGIGFTFPLQTLIFTTILHVLRDISTKKGTISVFGDDLIYPRRLHCAVVKILNRCGFELNHDKTFVEEPFRESCGGDYYDSVDVRPARPQGTSRVFRGELSIASFVYKVFNSLIRRWEEVELPSTFAFLRGLLSTSGAPVYVVPPHFPDESGLKDGTWVNKTVGEKLSTNRRTPFCFRRLIPCLGSVAKMRPVGSMDIYYWNKLKSSEIETDTPRFSKNITLSRDGLSFVDSAHDVLVWRKHKGKKVGQECRQQKWVAFTTKRGVVFTKPALVDVLP